MAQSKAFDSNAGSWPKFSGFRALEDDRKQIRVLRLKNGSSGESAQYVMEHQTIETAQFAALSYSWGAPVSAAAQKQIIINGEAVLIRPILHAFFATLAAYDPKVAVWIDAVCIDQSNVDERNHQISIMGQIYKSAQKVYVWLGKGDDDTNYVFEHVGVAKPQTQFDVRQYSPCAEKLFKLSYWTRRWVIQEFALARELFIVCGDYVTTWQRLVRTIDNAMLANDERAQQTMNNFQLLRRTHTEQKSNLYELLMTYQGFRCIDRRDRAFALRGIAHDGDRLSPDYNDSVTDVYFRILSMMQLEGVLPEMTGYMWPDQAVVDMQVSLDITVQDFMASLQDKAGDRVFASLEFVDDIASIDDQNTESQFPVLSKSVVTSRDGKTFRGSGDFKSGDLVFNAYNQLYSGSGPYIVFRSQMQTSAPIGVLYPVASGDDLAKTLPTEAAAQALEYLETTNDIICNGIVRCARNSMARQPQKRILCHISRAMLFWRWTLFSQEKAHFSFMDHYRDIMDASKKPRSISCSCNERAQPKGGNDQQDDRQISHLEILPTTSQYTLSPNVTRFFKSGDKQEDVPQWMVGFVRACMNLDNSGTENLPQNQRTNLSYAAGEGHVSWTKYLLSEYGSTENVPDGNRRSPLSWAMEGGHEEVAELLLASDLTDPDLDNWGGTTPLIWAINTGFRRGVELLLDSDKVDPNKTGRSSRRPLSWAAQSGNSNVVEALLASEKVEPDAEDVDGITPLQWAARYGHEQILSLLLATGKVDCNKKNVHSRNALLYAVERGHTRIVELLLQVDHIDPEILDNERRSSLRMAAQLGHEEIFQLLLDSGKAVLDFDYDRFKKKK